MIKEAWIHESRAHCPTYLMRGPGKLYKFYVSQGSFLCCIVLGQDITTVRSRFPFREVTYA